VFLRERLLILFPIFAIMAAGNTKYYTEIGIAAAKGYGGGGIKSLRENTGSGVNMYRLAQCRIFDGFTFEEFETFADAVRMEVRDFGPCETIVKQWAPVERIAVVQKGTLSAYKLGVGQRPHFIGRMGKMDIIGLSVAHTGPGTSPMTVISEHAGSLVWLSHRDFLSPAQDGLPALRMKFALNLIGALADALMQETFRSEALSEETLDDKVLTFLDNVTRRQGSDTVDIGMTPAQFAVFLGTGQSYLSYSLTSLRRKGLIRCRGRMFTLNRAALAGPPPDAAIRAHVLKHLRELVAEQGAATVTTVKTHTELAAELGVDRNSLTRELRAMRRDGLIDYRGKIYTLFSMEG
jgi:CRP-like cAMP-binding protein